MEDIRKGQEHSSKAAERGEPSYVWRDGQKRRMALIEKYAEDRIRGDILEDGCGVGSYLNRFMRTARHAVGIEIEYERGHAAKQICPDANTDIVTSCGEYLPFKDCTYDLILSHEVIEHVNDDLLCVREMVRVLKPGGTFFICNESDALDQRAIDACKLIHGMRLYKAEELQALLEQAGFDQIKLFRQPDTHYLAAIANNLLSSKD